jgi:hypothetical protein
MKPTAKKVNQRLRLDYQLLPPRRHTPASWTPSLLACVIIFLPAMLFVLLIVWVAGIFVW